MLLSTSHYFVNLRFLGSYVRVSTRLPQKCSVSSSCSYIAHLRTRVFICLRGYACEIYSYCLDFLTPRIQKSLSRWTCYYIRRITLSTCAFWVVVENSNKWSYYKTSFACSYKLLHIYYLKKLVSQMETIKESKAEDKTQND